jgi:hypothetical protein
MPHLKLRCMGCQTELQVEESELRRDDAEQKDPKAWRAGVVRTSEVSLEISCTGCRKNLIVSRRSRTGSDGIERFEKPQFSGVIVVEDTLDEEGGK